ncbi:MAG: tetratricopeptide repeat protein [Deltaproteobacteria bacterium]|nr:tetratricopeptide repeat protein [Deltaproteobacteria bacterium]MBI3296168.1 tetratricopeptide repeat protein [Deltaproteobacteria bacterium]
MNLGQKIRLWVTPIVGFALCAASIAGKDPLYEQAKKAYDGGKYARALDLFSQVIGSSPEVSTRDRSHYYSGLIFFEQGYYYSSYLSFKTVLQSPDEHNRELFEKAIKNAVTIADKLDIVSQLGMILSKLPGALVAPSVAALNHFTVGVYQFSAGNVDEALSHLKSVSPENQYYGKALFYLGLLSTKKKEYREAAAFFAKCIEVSRGNKEKFALQELARLNLARVTYSGGDVERSVELYSQFLSSSPHWITVLLEASWPLMRMNDTTISLGNLHTVTSPFYQDRLVGEAFILRSTILYNLCKYEEMRQTLASFFEIYDPIIRGMQAEAGHYSGGESYYNGFVGGKLQPAFLSYVKRDDGVSRDMKVIELLRTERRQLAKLTRIKQVERIKAKLDDAEKELAADMGRVIEKLHQRKLAELTEQREQANYLKVEIVTGEKELIEGQKGLPPKRVVDVETTIADGFEFWPFKGEYWEDEMGAYVYTTESACIR